LLQDEGVMKARSIIAALSLSLLVRTPLVAQPPPHPGSDVSKLTISSPRTIRDLDAKDVRGVPTRLAWSPDGTWLYVRVSNFDRWSNETVRHVLIEAQGRRTEPLQDEPAWLARYWNVKSSLTSPAVATWRIKIDTREEQVRTTNVPREGNIGQHGDPAAGLDETVRKAAQSSQKTLFETFLLNGHVIGSAINGHVSAGRTFAWAPEPLAMVAFVTENGRLAVMNAQGHTREIKGAKKPLLPAWSENGQQLAWAQQTSSGAYTIKAVTIR
jgi:hypothetical protein